jgi:ribonucleoside-triphosphate reductase
MGDARPTTESLARFIRKIFHETANQHVVFSPDFTTCLTCHRTSRGLSDHCPYCRSDRVEGISMITGYYSRISDWNKGKRAELRERRRMDAFF